MIFAFVALCFSIGLGQLVYLAIRGVDILIRFMYGVFGPYDVQSVEHRAMVWRAVNLAILGLTLTCSFMYPLVLDMMHPELNLSGQGQEQILVQYILESIGLVG